MKHVLDDERLFQFFGGYFSQDWAVDAPTADGIVSKAIADSREPRELLQIAEQIDEYAARFDDDAALGEALFKELCCFYLPSADGLTVRGWLAHVSARLREGAERIERSD